MASPKNTPMINIAGEITESPLITTPKAGITMVKKRIVRGFAIARANMDAKSLKYED
jgi:hypothetical protein